MNDDEEPSPASSTNGTPPHGRGRKTTFPPDIELTSYLSEEKVVKQLPELEEFKKISYWLARRFWSEANAGNMSLRLDALSRYLEEQKLESIYQGRLSRSYPKLAGMLIAITGTGRRMRDTFFSLKENIGIIRIVEDGDSYETIWGCQKPTSELPSHLGIHNMLVSERKEHRAVLHTHPTTMVSLTHLPELQDSETLNSVLYSLHPETRMLMPEGIVYLDYDVPGSYSLGDRTAGALRTSRLAVWEHHGVVAVGESLDRAFDRVELIEKAAEIYWNIRAMGVEAEGIDEGA